jgi:hypothetical protein
MQATDDVHEIDLNFLIFEICPTPESLSFSVGQLLAKFNWNISGGRVQHETKYRRGAG